MTKSSARCAPAWAVLMAMAMILLTPLVLCSCGSKDETPKNASYFTGTMKSKSERMKSGRGGAGGG